MRKRSRRSPPRQPAPSATGATPDGDAELLDQITAGEPDPSLPAIAQAIAARLELPHTIGSAKALAQLAVDDRVRIHHHAKPRYLHGVHGTVVELDEHTATVCVHRPVGRFTGGEIRCPPPVLDRLAPAA